VRRRHVDAAALFGQRRQDLLVLSTPGPHVDAAAVALLSRVVSRERLSLCVVLTHDRCESLAPHGDDAAAAKLRERARRARELAARRKIALADAQALWIRDSLLGSTPQLSQLVADGEFLVAPGVVDPRTGAIRWLLTRAQELPMPPVQAR